jgi:hypothetical protein
MLLHQPNRAGTDLRRKLVCGLTHHAPSYSGVGASSKPGAVHSSHVIGVKLGALHVFDIDLVPKLVRRLPEFPGFTTVITVVLMMCSKWWDCTRTATH